MSDPERVAMEVLRTFKVEKAPIPIERIAKGLGATLQFEPFEGKGDVSAMLYRDDERTVIGVNSTHGRTRQRFSIAHECGHLKLHKGKMYVDGKVNFRDSISALAIDKEEIEANAFAAELLMPREFVVAEIKKALRQHDQHDADSIVPELARVFDVSPLAMEFRLKNLGFIVE
jgi:Zn-dependent peptidase ImmA (M78 family)